MRDNEHMPTAAEIAWLLESDPAIRWKVLRDLTDASEEEIRAERKRVATEGWGARLLAQQDFDGRWDGGAYTPKWTSTTYTLIQLQRLGLEPGHPAALAGCQRLWDWAARWHEPETCIAGMFVGLSSHFGHHGDDLETMINWLLDQQLDDGGWNCATLTDKAKHSSFHTSITALEALQTYKNAGGSAAVESALDRGHEFFLRHRLYQSHRTGEPAIRASLRFPLLPQWHFDVLRGLEYFASADACCDERLADAIGVLNRAQRTDGAWPTYAAWPGKSWFTMEERGPSRWNTARVLAVLRWWDRGTSESASPSN